MGMSMYWSGQQILGGMLLGYGFGNRRELGGAVSGIEGNLVEAKGDDRHNFGNRVFEIIS